MKMIFVFGDSLIWGLCFFIVGCYLKEDCWFDVMVVGFLDVEVIIEGLCGCIMVYFCSGVVEYCGDLYLLILLYIYVLFDLVMIMLGINDIYFNMLMYYIWWGLCCLIEIVCMYFFGYLDYKMLKILLIVLFIFIGGKFFGIDDVMVVESCKIGVMVVELV